MRITILCAGRLRAEPEQALALDWISRARAAGRAFGLTDVHLTEIDIPGGMAREAEAFLAKLPAGAHVITLDERGQQLTSRAFAARLATLRDDGPRDVVFVIGGADGLGPAVKQRAQEMLAFGPWTWPHRLVRAMLAEQLFRAVTLWGGTPYHRD